MKSLLARFWGRYLRYISGYVGSLNLERVASTPRWHLEHFSLPIVEQVAPSQLHVSVRPRPASHSPRAAAAVGHEPAPVPQHGARSAQPPGEQPGGWYTPVARCNAAKFGILCI